MSAAGIDIDIVVVSGCCCLAGRGELGGVWAGLWRDGVCGSELTCSSVL
jgi:hypothetical protein